MSIPTKSLEFLMEGWRSHSKTGFHVTFLVGPGDEEFFKAIADGTRFQAVLVKLTDDDQPAPLPTKADAEKLDAKRRKNAEVEAGAPQAHTSAESLSPKPRFPGGLCGLAVRWCADEHFQNWIADTFGESWDTYSDMTDPEERAKSVVCDLCEVISRKALDENQVAGTTFTEMILEPYAAQRKADQNDGPF